MEKELKKYFDKQFGQIAKHFNNVDKRFGQVDQRFASVDKRFDSMDKRIDRMNKRFDSMDKRFDLVDSKIDDAVDNLARIIATTVAEPLERHIEETRDYPTMRKDVALLKHDVSHIKKVLQIK